MTAKAAKRPVIHDKKTLFFPCSVSSHRGQNSHTHSVVTLVTSEEVSRRTNHWPRNCFVRVTRFPFDPVRRCVGVFWVATSQVLPVFPLSIRDWLPAAEGVVTRACLPQRWLMAGPQISVQSAGVPPSQSFSVHLQIFLYEKIRPSFQKRKNPSCALLNSFCN